MADRRTMQSQLDDLCERLQELELRLDESKEPYSGIAEETHCDSSQAPHFCCVPPQPKREFAPQVTDQRARAIVDLGDKWVNGTPLRYYFFTNGRFGGDSTQQDVVRRAFDTWKNIGIGLTFTEVTSPGSAEIRIGFDHTDGSWSYVGREILNRGVSELTMNFGWDLNVSGSNGLDTAVHEIGHTLGLNHEHQNSNAGIVWNEQAVYDYFARTQSPPWDRNTTFFNVLRKIDPATVGGSTWDPNSIMHYAFDAGLISVPAHYRNGLRPAGGLSEKDKQVIRQFYPSGGGSVTGSDLKIGESQILNIAPGEQKDLQFMAPVNRNYSFQTFGDSDTVMVLFEDDGTRLNYIAGDDDSGVDRNALLRVRLIDGRKYRLKTRLYYTSASGHPSVMVW